MQSRHEMMRERGEERREKREPRQRQRPICLSRYSCGYFTQIFNKNIIPVYMYYIYIYIYIYI